MTAALVLCVAGARAGADEILVSAAASLTDAMNEIGAAYTRRNPGTVVRFNFGASGALEKQIEQGAPVDVFASASPKEMDALERANRIVTGTRVDIAGNRLTLIAPLHSPLRHWDDLRSAAVRRIAISNPDSVPSGRYAQESLAKRGLWGVVQPKAVLCENVRQTLAYVAGGNVDAGVVFATDAQIENRRVRIVDTGIPGKDHDPIVYPAAVVSAAPNAPVARRFVSFLLGPESQSIFARFGFTKANPTAGRVGAKPPSRARKAQSSHAGAHY